MDGEPQWYNGTVTKRYDTPGIFRVSYDDELKRSEGECVAARKEAEKGWKENLLRERWEHTVM